MKTVVLISICAWCKRSLAPYRMASVPDNLPECQPGVCETHGICAPCKAGMLAELRSAPTVQTEMACAHGRRGWCDDCAATAPPGNGGREGA